MTVAAPPIEQHFLLDDADWELYDMLLRRVGDRRVFLTYDQGRLEFMSPSYEHDLRGYLIALLINVIAEELDVPIRGAGSTTFRRKDLDRGLEPDRCSYIAN